MRLRVSLYVLWYYVDPILYTTFGGILSSHQFSARMRVLHHVINIASRKFGVTNVSAGISVFRV
jgi:hypothetical protein